VDSIETPLNYALTISPSGRYLQLSLSTASLTDMNFQCNSCNPYLFDRVSRKYIKLQKSTLETVYIYGGGIFSSDSSKLLIPFSNNPNPYSNTPINYGVFRTSDGFLEKIIDSRNFSESSMRGWGIFQQYQGMGFGNKGNLTLTYFNHPRLKTAFSGPALVTRNLSNSSAKLLSFTKIFKNLSYSDEKPTYVQMSEDGKKLLILMNLKWPQIGNQELLVLINTSDIETPINPFDN